MASVPPEVPAAATTAANTGPAAPAPAPEPAALPRIKSDIPDAGPPVSSIPLAPASMHQNGPSPGIAHPPVQASPPPGALMKQAYQAYQQQQQQQQQQQPPPPAGGQQQPPNMSPAGQTRPLRWASVAVPGQTGPPQPQQGHYQPQHQYQHPQAGPPQPLQYYQSQHPPPQQQPQYQQQPQQPQPPSTPQHGAPAQQYQQQQAPPPASHLQPLANMGRKPVIMDPPGNKIPPAQIQSGFPSPTIDHARTNPKFLDDVSRLTYGIHQSLPESVHRAVRDNWEKALMGSEYHQLFIMHTIIHRTTPSVIEQACHEIAGKMIDAGRSELISHFTSTDIDAVSDIIFDICSNEFLDRALDIRLRTIEAKPLINKLAMAERLGYDPGDIVEDGRGQGQERVIPTQGYHAGHQQHHQPAPQQHAAHPPQGYAHPHNPAPPQPSVPTQIAPGSRYQCPQCYRLFATPQPYEHHMKKQVCQRTPSTPGGFKHSCPHCGQGFTTSVGLQYHEKNKVCGEVGDTNPPSNIPIESMSSTPAPAPAPAPAAPSTPGFKGYSASQQQPMGADPYSTPNSLSVVQPPTSGPHNPYAHLSAQQFAALTGELRQAEVVYGERMNSAKTIPDAHERAARLEGLRNSFGTKQSMIRKKYGVRLRERRTKAAINAERERMESGNVGSSPAAAAAASSSTPSKASGWTAANVSAPSTPVDGHEAKRQRMENGEKAGISNSPHDGPADDAPHKVPSANMAPSEGQQQDPPASLPSHSYNQAGAHVQIHIPSRSASATESGRGGTDTEMKDAGEADNTAGTEGGVHRPERPPQKGLADLVALSKKALGGSGKATNNNNKSNDDTESESSSDDDADIPAKLPEAVRQTLTPANRPGSSSAASGK